MLRSVRATLFASVFAIFALTASTALAAPTAWEAVHVTLHPEQTGGVLMVSGDLPSTSALPAEVELAVPSGLQSQWIGEILGGDPSADPAVQYTRTTAGASDVYRFTLTKSRTAQIEVRTATVQRVDGTTLSPSLVWTSTQAVPEVRMSVRIPQGSRVVTESAGATLQAGESGYQYYTKLVSAVKPGDRLELTFSYTAPTVAVPAAGGTAGASAPAGTGPEPALLVVVAGALVILTWVAITVVRRGSNPSSAMSKDKGSADDGRSPQMAGESTRSRRAEQESTDVAGDPEGPARPGMSGRTKRIVATVAIIAVLGAVAVVVGQETTKPQLSGDTISQTFAAGDPCATADIALTVSDDAEPGSTAEALFTALRPVTGMNTATYDRRTSVLRVGFCESTTSEATVRAALLPTGLLAAVEASASPVAE